MIDPIHAPWKPEQVAALNRFQHRGGMHPFTCPHDHPDEAILTAHPDGWHCPDSRCRYWQDWAHAFMADPKAWPTPLADLRGVTVASVCIHPVGYDDECPCPPGCECCNVAPAPIAHPRPGLYRHYKGGVYEVIATATNTETGDPAVIYRSDSGEWWTRPLAVFDGTVASGEPRFEAAPPQRSAAPGSQQPITAPFAAGDCEHVYAYSILGGHPISVGLCMLCHTPNWDDLAEQAVELYRWGWQEGRDGKPLRETLSAYDKPRDDTASAPDTSWQPDETIDYGPLPPPAADPDAPLRTGNSLPPAPADGPSVQEAAADDARWALEKCGE